MKGTKMKEAKNLDRLTDLALDSFGIANPINRQCPVCKKFYPLDEFDGDACYTCYKLIAEAGTESEDR